MSNPTSAKHARVRDAGAQWNADRRNQSVTEVLSEGLVPESRWLERGAAKRPRGIGRPAGFGSNGSARTR